MFTKVIPKVGQIVKQGGERYEAFNAGTTALKAGDAIELVSGDYGRIGVQKLDTGDCIGFVVSESIDHEIKKGEALTYATSNSFIALNAVGAIEVGDLIKPVATGVSKATLPADAALVIGKAFSDAANDSIVIAHLNYPLVINVTTSEP